VPVNYLLLSQQIRDMGRDALSRAGEIRQSLEQLSVRLNENAENLKGLQRQVEEAAAKTKGLRCAVPLHESLNAHFPCTLPAPASTIFAADGSQINPDPHDSVLYGLVNIGVFCIQPHSGRVPLERTESHLLFGDELYASGGMASEDLVALLRDVQERRTLAQLAHLATPPVITLTDGPLELYHEPRTDTAFKEKFEDYLRALDDLAIANVITAGYVSRPRADLVVRLLTLNEESSQPTVSGISDIALFHSILQPGERSAIFRLHSRSADEYKDRKALHFFYLNVGSPSRPAFARVEIPQWVAENPQSVQTLHTTLVEQSALSGEAPYPYPLIRAHEIAVVKLSDRQQLTTMIESELARQGILPGSRSEKQVHKDHPGRTRINP